MYNLTALQNNNGFYDLVYWANITTGQKLMMFFVIAIGAIILLNLMRRQYSFKDSFASTMFIVMVVSVFLTYAKLLPDVFLFGVMIFTAFTGAILYWLVD